MQEKQSLLDFSKSQLFLSAISLFATSLFLFLFYKPDFALTSLNELIISEATAKGIDVSSRIQYFYRSIIIVVVLFPSFYLLFRLLKTRCHLSVFQLQSLAIISLFGLFNIFISVIGKPNNGIILILSALVVFKLISLSLPLHASKTFRLLKTDILFNSIAAISFLTSFCISFIFNTHTIIITQIPLLFSIFFLFYFSGFYFIFRFTLVSPHQALFTLLPLTLTPLFLFISVELQFWWQSTFGFFIRYKLLFLLLTGISFVIVLTWVMLKKKNTLANSTLFARFYAPSVLIAVALMSFYHPIIEQSVETFELANPLNSIMRIFAYNQIPLIDFMSSHMLSEQWFGILYSFIFGFNGTQDVMIYAFLNHIIFLSIVYYTLVKLFGKADLSLFLILFFPFLFTIFYSHIFVAVIMLFISLQLIKKQSMFKYLVLFASLFAFILWRLDTGVAAMFSTIIFIILLFIIERQRLHIRNLVKGLSIFVIGICLALFIAVVLRSPQQIISNFYAALHYVTANQAHGFSELASAYPQQFYIYYVLLPLIAVVASFYIVYFLYQINKDPFEDKKNKYALLLQTSLFLFLLFLTNAQRGLVRHSFFEDTERYFASTFFIALGLLIVFIFRVKQKSTQWLVFSSSTFVLFICFKFFPITSHADWVENGLQNNGLMYLDKEFNDAFSGRVRKNQEFETNLYTEFAQFMDTHFADNQTFLDFSNTPVLYFYCNRPIPGYFNQNLQNSVNDYLQFHLLDHLSPEHVPVVVYSNYPPAWGDATDGVPNVMRYYIVAEHIFSNYKPFAVISNKSIWIHKNYNLTNNDYQQDTIIYQATIFPYKQSAFYIADYIKRTGNTYLEQKFQYEFSDNEHANSKELFIPHEFCSMSHCYLFVNLENRNTKDMVYVHLRDTNNSYLGHFSFETIPSDNQSYMIRLSNNYLWHIRTAHHIIIDTPSDITIKSISLFKDTRFENKTSTSVR
jgi:hypothetical protein